jgi:hypothetical protein
MARGFYFVSYSIRQARAAEPSRFDKEEAAVVLSSRGAGGPHKLFRFWLRLK